MIGVGLGLVFAVAAIAAHADEPVTVRATAEPTTVTVGQRFRYTVEVTAGDGAEVLAAQPTETIGAFDIVDFGVEPAQAGEGHARIRRWYTLVGWTPGHHLLRSPPVRYRTAGTDLAEAPPHEMGVRVESLLAGEPGAADLRDIRPPEAVPVDWRPYLLLGGAVAVLLATLVALVAWSRRTALPAGGGRPDPPHVLAERALAALRARRLVEAGRVKDFYAGVSDVVRAYLEARYGVRAPEMTTEEFLLAAARDGRLAPAHRRLLGDFLTESDLVKFARHRPALADAERAFDAALRFVAETAPALAEEPRAAG